MADQNRAAAAGPLWSGRRHSTPARGFGDISDNLIHDNNRGLSPTAIASVSLSATPSMAGGLNVFNNNTIGIRCSLGGSLTGILQTFIDNVIDQGKVGSCPVTNALGAFTGL